MTLDGRCLFELYPLTPPHARDLLSWRYDIPYDFYDPPSGNAERIIEQLCQSEAGFYSICEVDTQTLVGFCSFGDDGKLTGYEYAAGPIDIGLGMAPNLTGQGLGRRFMASIIAFSNEKYRTRPLRLTVATFNRRAIALYGLIGFDVIDQFQQESSAIDYLVMQINPEVFDV